MKEFDNFRNVILFIIQIEYTVWARYHSNVIILYRPIVKMSQNGT